MATTAEIRNGLVMEYRGQLMKVISFLHVKPGKGGAFVRTKLKNVISGQVIDVTFRSGEKISPVRLESTEMQYLYADGSLLILMDVNSYEQVSVPVETAGESGRYLKEGMIVMVNSVRDEVIGIDPPLFVELKVAQTEPGVRGDTATGGTKSAVMETGLSVNVPLFVEVGDILKVDTRSGQYVERVT